MPKERGKRVRRIPYNPGLRDLIESKNAWDARKSDAAKRQGFSGWHERGYLPHRDAPGLTQFITFHLADAFPAKLIREWEALLKIEDDRKRRVELESYLDKGRGNAWLQRPEIAELCEHAFLYFNGERYELKAWCVMPNHGHVLVKITSVPMSAVVKSWKGYTGGEANRLLGRTDSEFWAEDYWDTFMRNDEQERRAIRYTENNPVKAGLGQDPRQWRWSSARFRDDFGRLALPARG